MGDLVEICTCIHAHKMCDLAYQIENVLINKIFNNNLGAFNG